MVKLFILLLIIIININYFKKFGKLKKYYYICTIIIKLNNMDNILVKQIHNELNDAIKQILDKHNLNIVGNHVSYNQTEFNISIKSVEINKSIQKPIDKDVLQYGFALPGTPAYINDRGIEKKVIILSARRTKYVIEFVDNPGKQFLIPFKGCYLKNDIIATIA
jgi:hypothetical protein